MKALIKKNPTNPPQWYQGLEIIDRDEPQVTPERPVKIATVSAGICGTDVGIYLGKDSLAIAMSKNKSENVILGHEFCGQITELHDSAKLFVATLLLRKKLVTPPVIAYVGSASPKELAERVDFVDFLNQHFYVSAEMHFTCKDCLQCRIGHEHVCKKTIGKGLHEDGAFTDFMILPADRLVLFEKGEVHPDIISFMDALGNAVHTAQSTDVVGKTILITGAGVQGLMSAAVARQLGANKIFITDVVPQDHVGVDKFSIAKKLGVDGVFDVGTEAGRMALAQTIAQETDNTGVDVVFEMSGNYRAYTSAFASVRMGGELLLLGLPAGKLEVDFTTDVVFKGLTIKGIYGRRIFDTWDLMRYLLAKGLEKTILDSGIITHRLPLAEFNTGFQALMNGQAIKVLLKP